MDATRQVVIDDLAVDLGPWRRGPRRGVDHRLQPYIARRLGIGETAVAGYRLDRRSLDARRRGHPVFRYRVVAEVADDAPVREGAGIAVLGDGPDENLGPYQLDLRRPLPRTPVVVGTGPAGIMAAYLLALHGCRPLVLDRGHDVERRNRAVAQFLASRELDPASNYLVGEGGAGTFSDGKLYTRVKDRRMRFLLEAFVAARAPRRILYHHHPHIGSDLLPYMARRLRERIEEWGGSFRWGAEVVDLEVRDGACRGVILADGERIDAPLVVMAVGHSARDLIRRLARRGLDHRAKGFQIGCRIEHPQELVDRAQIGCRLPRYLLPAAEYHLVSRPKRGPGTTTFCMCPGGEVLAATSDPGRLSTNGMSRHARASGFANAGLIVNQEVDRSRDPLEALDFLDRIEAEAFAAGGGDYRCPAQGAGGFLRGEAGPPAGATSYALGVRPGRIDRLLPPRTVRGLGEALRHFDRRIRGFVDHGTLIGIETRVSSPVRFERDPETLASSVPGLYLAGEGAGFAGGIVSAALDGLRLAETILTGAPAKR